MSITPQQDSGEAGGRYWVTSRTRPESRTRLRLFCFPHAGASGSIFLEWSRHLPPWIEVAGIQLPGRGPRIGEPPLRSVEQIVSRLSHEIDRDDAVPSLFFGHSFGGVVAYELARLLCEENDPRLKGLVISSCPAPHVAPKRSFMLHDLPQAEFFRELHKLGGIPPGVFENRKMQELVEPALRADIRCRELWSAAAARRNTAFDPLPVPIYPMGGTADRFVCREDLAQWCRYTADMRPVTLFDGGHFYFQEQLHPVAAAITNTVEELLGP